MSRAKACQCLYHTGVARKRHPCPNNTRCCTSQALGSGQCSSKKGEVCRCRRGFLAVYQSPRLSFQHSAGYPYPAAPTACLWHTKSIPHASAPTPARVPAPVPACPLPLLLVLLSEILSGCPCVSVHSANAILEPLQPVMRRMFYIRWCGLFLLGMGIGFTVLISVGRSWIPFIREIPVFLLTVVPLATVGIYVLSLVGGKWYVGQQARSVSDNLSRYWSARLSCM